MMSDVNDWKAHAKSAEVKTQTEQGECFVMSPGERFYCMKELDAEMEKRYWTPRRRRD